MDVYDKRLSALMKTFRSGEITQDEWREAMAELWHLEAKTGANEARRRPPRDDNSLPWTLPWPGEII